MRILMLLLTATIVSFGCASSEKNSNKEKEYPNLVSLNPPEDQKQEESNIYIDTVESITQNKQKALLISGSFPDGCTHLKAAKYSIAEDTLKISLEAWREAEMMCAQVLTSFSFIYDEIPEQSLKSASSVMVNGRMYRVR